MFKNTPLMAIFYSQDLACCRLLDCDLSIIKKYFVYYNVYYIFIYSRYCVLFVSIILQYMPNTNLVCY